MFKRICRAFVVARTASALSQLSDRQLAEIGIERGQINSYAEKINA